KSTLCERIVPRLTGEGHTVGWFKEEDIRSRAEFAEMMASFERTGEASTDQLREAAAAYAQSCIAAGADSVVQDMLFPYLPSLLAWGHSDQEIAAFFIDLADRCEPVELVQVHLVGDPERALRRAASREDPGWLDWLIAKVGRYQDLDGRPVDDFPTLVGYFARAQRRTRQLLDRVPWPCSI